MAGVIARYLEDDHARIDDSLRRAERASGQIDLAAYAEFRGALLRHIGMEEKILLPAATRARGGKRLDAAEQLHLDHGALAALLVPTPTRAIVDVIRKILTRHNTLEEGPNGMYAECEKLPGLDTDVILHRLQSAPPVALAPYSDSKIAMDSLHASLKRAGYSFEV
jgi:Hemerythrin HHE cation binding domain